MIDRLPLVAIAIIMTHLENDSNSIVSVSEVFPQFLQFLKTSKLEIICPIYKKGILKNLNNIYCLPKLKELSISMVGLNMVSMELPETLKYSRLERLELFHVRKIPESLGLITSLEKIIFWQSTFNSLTENFTNLVNLKSLELRYCYQVPEDVIDGMRSLPSLKEIIVLLHHYRRDIDL